MKRNFRKPVLAFLCLGVMCFLLDACHERGCTDRKAINFNVTADEDDGSCILCNTNQTVLDTMYVNMKDDNFSSPFFNQQIARFFLNQHLHTPNDTWCGNQTSTVSVTAYSLINRDMYLPFRIFEFSGPVNIFITDNILIGAGDTVEIGVAQSFTVPPFLPLSIDSIIADNQGTIIYY